ncbi:hypothetical protein [Catenuloplanes indicus]|uniref:Uncharacterized protein n=1 Tax=Catenuloplanes indicus TaxID=137267 RepID=A0AAE3W210_9ACTN|nr:hypothetical protein [Catenuloplanes indicus]MDQ0368076.1 hypothetical protein [Catenuloplanes indicus]
MGTLGGNGDVPPPDDSDLPELPPEWRSIVIPDDASALADEAAAVRRELRERQRTEPPAPIVTRRAFLSRIVRPPSETALRIPLVIMGIAIITTLTSLFLVSWLGQPRTPAAQRTATGQTPGPGRTLPALDLIAADGSSTPLRALLPAVFVITDGCACDRLLQETLRAAPPGVRVVAVNRLPASGPPGTPTPGLLSLIDQAGSLRAVTDLPEPTGGGGVVLVDDRNEIVRTIPAATGADEYRVTLEQLR